jgi:hypothetical protein
MLDSEVFPPTDSFPLLTVIENVTAARQRAHRAATVPKCRRPTGPRSQSSRAPSMITHEILLNFFHARRPFSTLNNVSFGRVCYVFFFFFLPMGV